MARDANGKTVDIDHVIATQLGRDDIERARKRTGRPKKTERGNPDIPDLDYETYIQGHSRNLPNGAANIEWYKGTIAYLVDYQLWHLRKFNQKIDLSPQIKSVLSEAEARGVDLGEDGSRDAYAWVKDGDLLGANAKNLDTMEMQLAKLPPRSAEEEALKKNWTRLIRRVRTIQAWARLNDHVAWTYIGRDQEKGRVFEWQDFHLEMAKIILDGRDFLGVVPTGHGKTELLNGLSLCELGRNPELRACFLYNTQDVAKRIEYIRSWMEHPRFKAIYPETRINTRQSDTKTAFYLYRKTPTVDPSVEGRSVGQKSEGAHFDRIIWDDIHTRESATSELDRRGVVEAMDNTWVKRLNPSGIMRGIMTRWHDADYAGVVMRRQRERRERGLTEAADVTGRMTVYVRSIPYQTDKDGRKVPTASLWENRFPFSQLQGEWMNDPVSFARDRLCDPTDQGSEIITRLSYYTVSASRSNWQTLDRWLSVDPALATTREADFSGCVRIDRVVGKTGTKFAGLRRGLVRDAKLLKKRPAEMVEMARAYFENDEIDFFCYETKGPAGAELLREIHENLGDFASNIRAWPGINIQKSERLKSVSIVIVKYLLFPGHKLDRNTEESLWEPDGSVAWLANHILRFSAVANPDGVDAVTQWLMMHRDWLQGTEDQPEEAKPVLTQEQELVNHTLEHLFASIAEQEPRADAEMEYFAMAEL